MNFNRKSFLARILMLAAIFLVLPACTNQDGNERVAEDVLVNVTGVAIEGYDPVAYFTEGGATRGSAEFSVEWNGARWWFASADNLAAFQSAPETYAPAYGGWCAYGVAEGYAAETDPVNGWTIHEGRLYLNWDASITQKWRGDVRNYLQSSESNWAGVKKGLDDGSATVYWHED